MSDYHVPALLEECIAGLDIKPNGIYVDVTFGGGGHSKAIIEKLENGKLIAFDQDPESVGNKIDDNRFTLITQNFKYLKNFLKLQGITAVDGILADLGVSFHQFDKAERGFSIRQDGPLDMRMNQGQTLTAEKVINEYEQEDLRNIFRQYGELKDAGRVAGKICRDRNTTRLSTTSQLISSLAEIAPFKKQNQYFSKVFQAIRIEVNQELDTLKTFLQQSTDALEAGGRMVIISYHSLEDRLVKEFFRSGNFNGDIEKDLYGNILRPLDPVNRKVIVPNASEIENNPRSRSAKLRIASKR